MPTQFHFFPQVWAGNEDCEDVTWQECKLVERKVDFTVPKVECVDDGNPIPYMRFVNTTKAQMLNKMTCEVSENHFSCERSKKQYEFDIVSYRLRVPNHASLWCQQSVQLSSTKSVPRLPWRSALSVKSVNPHR